MNVITVPSVSREGVRIDCYHSAYVLQSVAGALCPGDVFPRRNEDVKKVEKKVEPIVEVNDGRLDLFG